MVDVDGGEDDIPVVNAVEVAIATKQNVYGTLTGVFPKLLSYP